MSISGPRTFEILRHRDPQADIAAVVRFLHFAGPLARLTLEQVGNHDTVELELSRSELVRLNLQLDDLVNFWLRQGRLFGENYSI